MNSAFHKLDDNKRIAIINAGLAEFSRHGFQKASTNAIVARAGISKGLLFHYFSSKRKLYDYLQEFSIVTIVDAIASKTDWQEVDFFRRLKQIWLIKSEILATYPDLSQFSETFMANLTHEQMIKLVEKYQANLLGDVYHKNIDFQRFKPSIDIEKAINVLQWTFEKIGEQWRMKLTALDTRQLDELSVEIDSYLNLLQHAFYKEEYIHD